ncbi:MAG: hypothetical protein ACPGVU_18365, partial [Limisphaerales bacterium]
MLENTGLGFLENTKECLSRDAAGLLYQFELLRALYGAQLMEQGGETAIIVQRELFLTFLNKARLAGLNLDGSTPVFVAVEENLFAFTHH